MDKNYYFVVEPGGSEDGPYILTEIARRLSEGAVSQGASLMRVGDTKLTPISQVASAFARTAPPPRPPRRPVTGTQPPPYEPPPMPMTLAIQPYVAPPPPQFAPPRRRRTRMLVAGGVAVLAVGSLAIAGRRGGHVEIKDSMVRVSTPTGTGAGFLIDGPDDYVYVATANHVVDRGERILIERDVEINDKRHYVEAYPETEIVASDADSDLAILRVKNVDAHSFHRLALAKEPVKDAKIFSYGYPGSSLARHAGLVSKDGKILSLVMFPAYDDRYSRIVRENAVDGLLVSTDIEPGFSGGPTCNEAGEVVGINVTKDHAHVGQNGAVSVVALRSLLQQVKPASAHADPRPDEIVALLKRIQSEYLLLPLDQRSKVRETDFLNATDLPTLRRFVGEVRREERNTDTTFVPKLHLSGQAALGIFFARLPGKLLETYRAPTTAGPLAACESANRRLASFLGDLDNRDRHADSHVQAGLDTCDELALRPLAWDLAAATLQWDGKEKDYTVTKVDRMDDEGRSYRASVRISGATNLVELWIGMDRGMPRLELFDTADNLYAIDSPRNIAPTALQGTWVMKQPRITDAIDKEAEVEGDETLSVSIVDGKVSIRSVTTQRYFVAGKRQQGFKCNHKSTIDTGLLQSFTGTIENGVVVALPEKDAEPIGADAGACESSHKPDRIVAAKLVGDQLYLYRTDGNAYPEALQFTKQ